MYTFGKGSQAQFETLSDGLKLTANKAITTLNFSIIEGHRPEGKQRAAFAAGLSKVNWPHSRHNPKPSQAMDCYPYHSRFGALTGHPSQIRRIAAKLMIPELAAKAFVIQEFHRMAGVMIMAASSIGMELLWGGDWDRDGDTTDQIFNDLAHFSEA